MWGFRWAKSVDKDGDGSGVLFKLLPAANAAGHDVDGLELGHPSRDNPSMTSFPPTFACVPPLSAVCVPQANEIVASQTDETGWRGRSGVVEGSASVEGVSPSMQPARTQSREATIEEDSDIFG